MKQNPCFIISEPASYLEMILLESESKLVITDSGGVQKEACFFRKPCIILRAETEWTELVEARVAILADDDPVKISNAFDHFKNAANLVFPDVFGDGKAAEYICEILITNSVNHR